MNKFILGGGLLLVAVFFYFMQEEIEVDKSQSSFTQFQEPVETPAGVEIEMEESKKQKYTPKKYQEVKKPGKKVALDKKIKYTSFDKKHKYKIELIDEEKHHVTTTATKPFRGRIGKDRFIVKVPAELADDENLKLRVTKIASKETKLFDVPIVSDLTRGGFAPGMVVYFENGSADVEYPEPVNTNFPE